MLEFTQKYASVDALYGCFLYYVELLYRSALLDFKMNELYDGMCLFISNVHDFCSPSLDSLSVRCRKLKMIFHEGRVGRNCRCSVYEFLV